MDAFIAIIKADTWRGKVCVLNTFRKYRAAVPISASQLSQSVALYRKIPNLEIFSRYA